MKSFAHKLAALTCSIALFAGCASVTDANLTEAPQEENVQEVAPQPEGEVFGTGAKMSPIYDKPTMEDYD